MYNSDKHILKKKKTIGENLAKNAILRNNIKQVKVHWTGPQSAEAFSLLKQVQTLRELTIIISKSTTDNLSAYENEMRGYFSGSRQVRISDALGFEELLQLSGLRKIEVEHVDKTQAARRTNEDLRNVQSCLTSKCKA